MLFVTYLEALPGKYNAAIKLFKNPRIPNGIVIKESLWMFGKPDAMIVFEAPDEKTAGEFVVQFGEIAVPKTSLVFPIDELTWIY
jgi:uncharacterized protein with GYD domain